MIMEGRRGTGKIVNFIHFHMERKANVMAHEFKMARLEKMFDVLSRASEKIVDAEHFMSLTKKAFA